MSMHGEDYKAAAEKTAFNIWQWGQAHTFIAGLAIGVVADRFLWWVLK